LIRDAIENKTKLIKSSETAPVIHQPSELIKTESLENDFSIAESNEVLKILISSLLVDESVKAKISESYLKDVSKVALDFVENKAGVDWFVRAPQISRLKNIIRRQLKKIDFPDDYLKNAAHSLAFTVAKMSYEKDRKKDQQETIFKDITSENSLFDEVWSAEKE
jgi:superfamily I DNA and RNA helicase